MKIHKPVLTDRQEAIVGGILMVVAMIAFAFLLGVVDK